MSQATVILITLVIYKIILIGFGLWAERRVKDNTDFFVGGRELGPVVTAVSFSASASSAWALLGLSGAAFIMGLSVLWILIGIIISLVITWLWIAPRMFHISHEKGFITLTDFITYDLKGKALSLSLILSAVVIVISFIFYVAAQFQGAGQTFATNFDMSLSSSILIGGLVIVAYTMLGGFWAVSLTDTLQGILMALGAFLLATMAVIEVGGFGALKDGLLAVVTPDQLSMTGGNVGLMAIGLIMGLLSVGLGMLGQPHLLNRFMALKSAESLPIAQTIGIGWYLLVYICMILLGFCGHILVPDIANPEGLFFRLTQDLFPLIIGGILTAAVLSAIMSTADSQLLVIASVISHDLKLEKIIKNRGLLISRLIMVATSLLAIAVAIFLPEAIFSRVLFAWNAIGAAFGPIVICRLAGMKLSDASVPLAISVGFFGTVILYLMPNMPGDFGERFLPFFTSIVLLWLMRRK